MRTLLIVLGVIALLVIIYLIYRYYNNKSQTAKISSGTTNTTSVPGNETTPDGITNAAITNANLNKTVYANTTVHPYVFRTDSGDGAFPEYMEDMSVTYPVGFNLGKFKESFSAYSFDKLIALAVPAIVANPTSNSQFVYWNAVYTEQQLRAQVVNIANGEKDLLHGNAKLKRYQQGLGLGQAWQLTVFNPAGAVITLYKVTGVDGVDRFFKKEDVKF